MENDLEEKRKNRKKQTAEDFTPEWLVNQMIDKLFSYGPEMKEEGKTFCDPACGNGNILIEVLKRKLSLNHSPLISIKSIYGADIMEDNIKECRKRLIEILKSNCKITKTMIKYILKNIVWTPTSVYKNGALDYDFCFSQDPSEEEIEKWYNGNQDNEVIRAVEEQNLFNLL